MNFSGKNNNNYKHGIYCTKHYCSCGKEKDYRAKICIDCRLFKLSKENLEQLVSESNSFLELSNKTGEARTTITRYIKEYKINIDHFRPGRNRPIQLDKLFTKGTVTRHFTVKAAILQHNLLEHKCVSCGLKDIWENKKLTLQIDHINGDNTDNRLENLRFLCPNCHSQTTTYTGRNSYGIKKERKK